MQPHTPDPTRRSDLRYFSVDNLPREVVDLEERELTSRSGESLGTVDGFLVDASTGRPEYIVVAAGGWFSSRQYLLPVEHASLDAERRRLRANLDRDTITRFPELPADRLHSLRDDELEHYRAGVTRACCPDDADLQRLEAARLSSSGSAAWWRSRSWYVTGMPGAPSVSGAAMDDRVSAASEERTWAGTRDDARAASERAQPGDILGIESAGETTSLGDTAEDEDRRRERAEEDFRSAGRDSDRET
jgi:hypothetical protein